MRSEVSTAKQSPLYLGGMSLSSSVSDCLILRMDLVWLRLMKPSGRSSSRDLKYANWFFRSTYHRRTQLARLDLRPRSDVAFFRNSFPSWKGSCEYSPYVPSWLNSPHTMSPTNPFSPNVCSGNNISAVEKRMKKMSQTKMRERKNK